MVNGGFSGLKVRRTSRNTYYAYSRKGGENGEQGARSPEPVRT